MNIINKTKIAIGTSIIAGFATGCASSGDKDFSQKELSSGYMNDAASETGQNAVGKIKDATCGEGKCGEGKCAGKVTEEAKKVSEGKCGEGNCGDKNATPATEEATKMPEGKCGEGNCGDKK